MFVQFLISWNTFFPPIVLLVYQILEDTPSNPASTYELAHPTPFMG